MKKLFLILVTVFLNASLFANTNNIKAEAYLDQTPVVNMNTDGDGPILPPPPPPPGG